MADQTSPGSAASPGARARRRTGAVLAVAGMAAMVASSSGCVILESDVGVGQQGLLGPGIVRVHTCVSMPSPSLCPNPGLSRTFPTPTPGVEVQGLLGIEMPDAIRLPQTLPEPTGFPSAYWWGGTWTQSASYAAELTALSRPRPGRHWTGYISEPGGFTPGHDASGDVHFDLPEPAAVVPGGTQSLQVTVVVGARQVTSEAPGDRPVLCDVSDATVCIDDRFPLATSTFLHNLAIPQPPAVTAERGTTATVPVSLQFMGTAAPEYTFALTATTTLPGTTATPNVPTIAPPTNSTTSVSVAVPVPVNAPAGTYDVTITATVGGTNETRSATGTLIVPPAPGTTPPPAPGGTPSTARVALISAIGVTTAIARSRGIPVTVSSDATTAATVTLTQVRRVRSRGRLVRRRVQLARRTVTLTAGANRFRVGAAGLRRGRVAILVSGDGFSVPGTVLLR